MLALAFLKFTEPWYVYVSMPLIAAIVGYLTKLVAIEMIFEPVEFVGIKPFLGWQGMVPRRAAKMAGIAVDNIIGTILEPRELFDLLDPDEMVKELEQPLHAQVAQMTEAVMLEFNPGVWKALPDRIKQMVVARIEKRVPATTRRLIDQLKDNVDQVLDIKHMVVTNLVRDKTLLNRMMRDISTNTLKFMARAGGIFGFYIGLVQVVVFIITGSHLVVPLFGLLTGGTTDWIALRMIFRPIEPNKRLFGLLPWQGVFHKLRPEVTADYARLLAKDLLTPRAVMESMLTGPMSDKLFEMIQEEIEATIDDQTGRAQPLVKLAIGSRKYQNMKKRIATRVIEAMPEQALHIETYAAEKLNLDRLMTERMAQLSDEQYEELLRPAFREDEKWVILVGAMLGFLVGEVQALVIL